MAYKPWVAALVLPEQMEVLRQLSGLRLSPEQTEKLAALERERQSAKDRRLASHADTKSRRIGGDALER
jgi:hypothetical protein